MSGTVITGAGHTGVSTADELRRLGDTAPVTIVGNESYAPHQRPPLSKAWLSDGVGHESISLRSADWYENNRVSLILSETATRSPRNDGG